jgi:hypothetical protein
MRKDALIQLLVSFPLASALWMNPAVYATAAEPAGSSSATDPRLDLATALQALGPHPALGDQAKVFGRLVGTWDVEYTDFSNDGKVRHRSGELIVGWILDGRAMQDLWIVDPSFGRKEREVYTTVRYFDLKSGTWPAIFIDPEHASAARFTGGAVGNDRIVLDTRDFGHEETRWSYGDIRPDAFGYREEQSSDGGKTWRLTLEGHMKRRGAAPSSQ